MTLVHQRLLHDSLLAAAEREPDKQALIVPGESATYAELLNSALAFARGLQERGLQRGERVALYMDNSLPCVTALFGTLLAGGVFMVVNPQTKEDKLAFILEDSEASILITEGSIARIAASAARASRA